MTVRIHGILRVSTVCCPHVMMMKMKRATDETMTGMLDHHHLLMCQELTCREQAGQAFSFAVRAYTYVLVDDKLYYRLPEKPVVFNIFH